VTVFKKLLPIALISLFVITACGSHDYKIVDNNEEVQLISPPVNVGVNGGSENTEYDSPTGRWFLGGGGSIGYSISTGNMKPNLEVAVSFMAHPIDKVALNRDVRFQLTTRDENNRLIEVVEEEIVHINTITSDKKYFSTVLPDRDNIYYMFSTEILGEDGKVEDTLVTTIYVPTQMMNGELYLDKDKYSVYETLILTLENKGPTNLSFGLFYEIEKYNEGKWERVPINVAFDAIGLSLEPGQSFEQKISLKPLKESGRYRVLKDIDADGTDLKDTLTVEFEVK
jgi:hypothetical protein